MNVIMGGIDHNLAAIDIRERFLFTKITLERVYNYILANDNISGAVIISTCNRTELYLSCRDGFYVNPFKLLCTALSEDFERYGDLYRIKKGNDVIRHLCEVACGVKSRVWGEDQIITQVKNAIADAREMKASDSALEVMFRNAITAAKKVKSTLNLSSRENSMAYMAFNIIKSRRNIEKALVIGNGEIGRLMAKILVDNGYDTTITLRQYHNGTNIVPEGVRVVDYCKRYEKLMCCDVVVSATLSPHYTIDMEELKKTGEFPELFIDLAVPRDIEPCIKTLAGIELFDVDSICSDVVMKNHTEQLALIDKIIEKYICNYNNWCKYKKGIVCV